MLTLGEYIKRERCKAGMNQAQLAVAANVSVVTLAGIERGQSRNPRLQTLRKILGELGIFDMSLTVRDNHGFTETMRL